MRRPIPVLAALCLVAACGSAASDSSATLTSTSTAPSTSTSTSPLTTVGRVVPPSTAAATTEAPTTTEPPLVLPEDGFSVLDTFTPLGAEPAIAHGPPGAWNARFTDPGAVVVHDGALHVFANAFPAWPGPVAVGYWRSDDGGSTWSQESPGPVFDHAGVPYAGVAVLASSALVEPDGTWVLYFYTWDDPSWPQSRSTIGRATAPAPTGPWTADRAPVVDVGPEGSWDSQAVRVPSVVRHATGYQMWFTGTDGDTASIGYATSSDGVTWTKHDDAATGDRYASSDPVLVAAPAGAWDDGNVHQPRVVDTPDGLVMLYTSINTITDAFKVMQRHGIAVSDDGVRWVRSGDEVIRARDIDRSKIWFTALSWTGDGYVMLLEGGRDAMTDVFAVAHAGRLFTA